MLRTEIMPVFGSRDPTTFTFSPDYCSANTCVSSLYNLSGVLQYESRAALFLIYRTYNLPREGFATAISQSAALRRSQAL
jgi:hypothetical protein